MADKYILDEQGEPVPCDDPLKWSEWFETANHRLAFDTLGYEGSAVEVSTVFLGINHNFGTEGPPLLWETLVSGPGCDDGYLERYSTEAEALRGHTKAVRRIISSSSAASSPE